ncbi:DUF6361 family protein [Cupriavidus sp. amp6]|uniref:DUF6361 family protein n=1 Tax=Cupriavidus sp. amp6 TaxID=388051 RepID=UPI0005673B53|nr:DUF6361 family protein [Cupriavidus sp. amp6]
MSTFGWTYLSRDALRRAEAQMADKSQGVRDEIGFLHLHQRYADLFFPGTSVLQTRLRYALFVPWMYQGLRARPPKGSVINAVRDAERRLVVRLLKRLPDAKEKRGIIGRDSANYISSQPPSMVYWGALGAWGILRRKDGLRHYSRADVHRGLRPGKVSRDDDGVPLGAVIEPFNSLPPVPDDWSSDDEIRFELNFVERKFFREQWKGLRCADGTRPLLAQLAQHSLPDIMALPTCWAEEVCEVAGDQAHSLRRASAAAALAGIGRSVYAALVEQTREQRDRQPTPRKHRDYLVAVVEEHAEGALRFDLAAVEADIGRLPDTLRAVLERTTEWLRSGKRSPEPLRAVYEIAEFDRKRSRARLPDRGFAQARRLEWGSDDYPQASPLHYRWDRVSQMLADLHGQS